MIVLIYIWDYNWILLLNNNKNTFIYLFFLEVLISEGNKCIFEIKMEFLVIYEMGLFKTLLFNW